jgi:hypothetical protein
MDRRERDPDCLRCAHYRVTWDPFAPRGCEALGFKSRELPAAVVRRNSGLRCQAYRRRTGSTAGTAPTE